jgi:dihydrolipoamide dehydrogenase
VTTTPHRKHRIVIIGGGPGGYEAALAGRQLGAEVILIERDGLGGNAVLTDVVPSKTLIAVADAAGSIAELNGFGLKLKSTDFQVDLKAVNHRLRALAREQSLDMQAALDRAGVEVILGRAKLDGNHAVLVQPNDGSAERRIETRTIIVSTGASPRELDHARPDGERIFNWKQLYNLEQVPEHLIVVGSGVTGAEFASAYLALGAKVTLVSSRDYVLPGEDRDAAKVLEEVFRAGGMRVMHRTRAERVENTGDTVRVTLDNGEVLVGSHALMAVGSIPNTAGLGLEEARVELTDSGHIVVNKVAGTSRANVYAAGDCTNFLPLASVSAMQGRTAVYHAMGDIARPAKLRNVASNVFTSPEIASVGWSEEALERGEVRGSVHRIDLEENPRAKMMGIKVGFIKLIASTSGTVIGGVVVGPKASELIYPIALAVENRLTVDNLARTFAVYPSLTGSIADAARALHLPAD